MNSNKKSFQKQLGMVKKKINFLVDLPVWFIIMILDVWYCKRKSERLREFFTRMAPTPLNFVQNPRFQIFDITNMLLSETQIVL